MSETSNNDFSSHGIIDSIFQNGLLSSKDQLNLGKKPFHSMTNLSDRIDGCLIPPWIWGEKDRTKSAIYDGAWAVMPVLAEWSGERQEDVAALPTDILEKRIQNSFLIIMPSKSLKLVEKSLGKFLAESPIEPSKFEAIVVPNKVYTDHPEFGEMKKNGFNIVQVGDVNRSVFFGYRDKDEIKLSVPDYESVVKKYRKKLGSVYIHGVRLPF